MIVNIVALVDSAEDKNARAQPKGETYYFILPIVSIVIPNPITTGITAYSPDCTIYNNCNASYRDLYGHGYYKIKVLLALHYPLNT